MPLQLWNSPKVASFLTFSLLQNCLDQDTLQELPTVEEFFTWTGVRRRGRVLRKLDRFLFNDSWLDCFPTCQVELLNRSTSDHNPLVLSYAISVQQPRPFRFQNMWLRRPDFMAIVQTSWEEPIEAYGMYRFSLKLCRLKRVLKEWNRKSVGDIHWNVRQVKTFVKELEEVFCTLSKIMT